MSRCTCQTITVGGSDLPDVVDVRCPTHGFPEDRWYPGHPLRRHAITVPDDDRFSGRRLERPSETYARLLGRDHRNPEGASA